MHYELKNGEEILSDTVANLMRGFEGVGGRLKITNQRLLFEAHSFNLQSMPTEIPLEYIVEVKKVNNAGFIPNGLLICTKNVEYKFVVWGRGKLITIIDDQILNYKKNKSVDSNACFCSYCGKPNSPDKNIRFCPECGIKIGDIKN